jgi:hypothetical protein
MGGVFGGMPTPGDSRAEAASRRRKTDEAYDAELRAQELMNGERDLTADDAKLLRKHGWGGLVENLLENRRAGKRGEHRLQ